MMQPVLWILCMLWVSAATEDCQECQGSAPPSKAGVAMLVRTKKADFASAVASMEDVTTDGIEREAALVNKVLTSPTAELTESVVSELASMRITPEVKIFIEATITNLKPVFNDLVGATRNDTSERDQFLNRFEEIKDNLTNNQAMFTQAKRNVDGFRQKHLTCRGIEKTKWDAKEECRAEESRLLQVKISARTSLENRENALTGLLCDDEDVTNALPPKIDAAGPYADAGRAYIKAEEEHSKKVKECNGLEQEWSDQQAECSTDQTRFESQMCTLGGKAKGWCSTYETEHDTLKSEYDIVWAGIQSRVEKRLYEWTHLKRVECVLNALKALETDTTHVQITESIEGCNASPYHNKGLIIDPKPAPDKVTCPYTAELKLPCSDEFVQTEYSSLPKEAPANKCVGSCV